MNQLSIHQLLKKYDISPRKSLGQNFLANPTYLEKIVQAAGVETNSVVLEIGPGLGNLTRFLVEKAGRVVAVELDAQLVEILKTELADQLNLVVVHGDILKVPLEDLQLSQGYLVVANIPYYITSAIIRRLLEAPVKPDRILLTVQREIADRICALPGEMSLLSLSVQVYGNPKRVFRIPAEAFYPAPKVDSAVLLVELYPQPVIPIAMLNDFFTLIKAGFSQKRKTLRNSLSGGLRLASSQVEEILNSAGVDPQRRAETLSLDEWASVVKQYRKLQTL
ncbi:MAG: 16S rRNA (adenine(1518)-N(6)/adenine(1519)-N(6))-dimethyltransferase RsmA [Anaerolineaceae bacterium]